MTYLHNANIKEGRGGESEEDRVCDDDVRNGEG